MPALDAALALHNFLLSCVRAQGLKAVQQCQEQGAQQHSPDRRLHELDLGLLLVLLRRLEEHWDGTVGSGLQVDQPSRILLENLELGLLADGTDNTELPENRANELMRLRLGQPGSTVSARCATRRV